ncbi:hypothetical protein MKX03_007743 [Papaver bracteatum]|nr:hypothetical protein MKX03_007743 [Papaver bracteatum]
MKNNQFNGVIDIILVAIEEYPDQTVQYSEQTTQYPDQTGDASGYGPAHLDTKHKFLAYQNAPRAMIEVRSDRALIHSDGPLGENLFGVVVMDGHLLKLSKLGLMKAIL